MTDATQETEETAVAPDGEVPVADTEEELPKEEEEEVKKTLDGEKKKSD